MIKRLLFLLLFSVSAWAQSTATVAPDGDNTTGGWSTTPLWSDVDDDIDSPDGTVIESGNNPSSPGDDVILEVTCPGDVDTITEANLRIRARQGRGGARDTSLVASWSATAATDVSTGTLTDALANYASGNQTGLSISKSTCDTSTLTIAPSTSGGGSPETVEVDSYNLDITYTAATGRREVVITQIIQPKGLK